MRVIEVETKDHLISAFKQAENKYLYNQQPTEIRIKRKSGNITSYIVGDTNRLYKGEVKNRVHLIKVKREYNKYEAKREHNNKIYSIQQRRVLTNKVENFNYNEESFSKGIKKTLAIIRKSKQEELFS